MAIEISELRLGNFIQDKNGKLIIVDSIVTEEGRGINAGISYNGCIPDYYPDDIFPIPITEEWLLKFGFLFDGAAFNNKIRVFKIANAVVWNPCEDVTATMQYVHQLQNLYFALTGKELEYKP